MSTTAEAVSRISARPLEVMKTILVAEDEPSLRRLICDLLEAQGFHVLCAPDGEEALRLAACHPGPIHLLLTDIGMPRVDGVELYGRLRRLRSSLRVLFSSSFGDDRIADRPFLAKPYKPPMLIARVRSLLAA